MWPFGGARTGPGARALVDIVSAMARRPGFFGEGRAPDSLSGRFEVLALHAALVFVRLKREPEHAPLAQAFADTLFRRVDSGLREAGVGDLTVPKRMRRMAGAFYGRLGAYGGALDAGDETALADALARNVLDASPAEAPFAMHLAGYMAALARAQAGLAPDALNDPSAWGAPPA